MVGDVPAGCGQMKNAEELIGRRQELAGVVDELFNRVVSGTSIGPREYERFYSVITRFTLIVAQIADSASTERCKALNEATRRAFGLMEADLERQFQEIADRLRAIEERLPTP